MKHIALTIAAVILLLSPFARFMVNTALARRSRSWKAVTHIALCILLTLFGVGAILINVTVLEWLRATTPEKYATALRCRMDALGDLTATAVISNPGSMPVTLEPDDLTLRVWRSDAAGLRQAYPIDARIVRGSSGVSLPFYVIQPRETAWLELRALRDDAFLLRFVRSIRPDDRAHRCDLYLPSTAVPGSTLARGDYGDEIEGVLSVAVTATDDSSADVSDAHNPASRIR